MTPRIADHSLFRQLPGSPRKLSYSKQSAPYFLPYIVGADKEVVCEHKHIIQDFSLGIIEPLETCMISLSPGVVLTTMNRSFPLEFGHLILVRQPAQITLSTQRHSQPWSSVYLNFRDEFSCGCMNWLRQRLGTVTDLRGDPGFQAFLDFTFRLVRTFNQHVLPGKEQASLLCYQWFMKLMQLCRLSMEQVAPMKLEETLPGQVLSTQCRTLKEFAHQTQYSPSYLSKKLSEIWNIPPGKVLRESRLQTAAELVRNSDLGINEIASRIGYQSTSSFIRAFKTRFGVSPGKLRHQYALGNSRMV